MPFLWLYQRQHRLSSLTIAHYFCRRALVTGDRYTIGDDDSLTIINVQPEDGSEYICRAFNHIGDPAYEYLTITVHRKRIS